MTITRIEEVRDEGSLVQAMTSPTSQFIIEEEEEELGEQRGLMLFEGAPQSSSEMDALFVDTVAIFAQERTPEEYLTLIAGRMHEVVAHTWLGLLEMGRLLEKASYITVRHPATGQMMHLWEYADHATLIDWCNAMKIPPAFRKMALSFHKVMPFLENMGYSLGELGGLVSPSGLEEDRVSLSPVKVDLLVGIARDYNRQIGDALIEVRNIDAKLQVLPPTSPQRAVLGPQKAQALAQIKEKTAAMRESTDYILKDQRDPDIIREKQQQAGCAEPTRAWYNVTLSEGGEIEGTLELEPQGSIKFKVQLSPDGRLWTRVRGDDDDDYIHLDRIPLALFSGGKGKLEHIFHVIGEPDAYSMPEFFALLKEKGMLL